MKFGEKHSANITNIFKKWFQLIFTIKFGITADRRETIQFVALLNLQGLFTQNMVFYYLILLEEQC
jgi:hypothetical protein